jgi:hypothetical protein
MEDMFNIVSAWGAQTNLHYNPDTANNGGGYWQYAGGIVADIGGQLVTVEVDDMSCGDFGSRVYFSVTADGFCWNFSDGTMDGASVDTSEDVLGVLRSISGVLGVDAEALISAALDAANICAWEVCYAG